MSLIAIINSKEIENVWLKPNWSLYHNNDNGNGNNNEQPLLEQISTTEDFHNMIDSYQWESEGYEVVVAK